MLFDETSKFEADSRFPSGPWAGFWTSDAGVGSMQLYLEFVRGRVRGEGSDSVGAFDITGRYWPQRDRIVLRKQYRNRHTVWYRGTPFRPYLKGLWRLATTPAQGRWRIWPVQDEFELVHLEIETANGPFVIHGEIRDEDSPKETLK